MNSISQSIMEYLDSMEYNYRYYDDDNAFSLTMSCKHTDLRVWIMVKEETDFVSCYSLIPYKLKGDKMKRVYEIINDINSNSMFAMLYYDKKNEVIISQTGMNVDGIELNYVLLNELIGTSIHQADESVDAILKVVYNDNECVENNIVSWEDSDSF